MNKEKRKMNNSTTNQKTISLLAERTRIGSIIRKISKSGFVWFRTFGSVWFVVNLFFSCSRQTNNEGLLIAVSIPPQAWFVSQIAADKANVMILAGQGQNPHSYEPTPRQVQSLASAGAWILSGMEFEISLRPRVVAQFANLLIVDGTQGVQFRMLEDACHEDHDHSAHSSLEIDRHTWLGREPAKILAAHIRNTLCQIDGENEFFYNERYENLINLIDEEFEKLKITLAPLNGKSVFVYHPSFGYFFDEFGIIQEAVETGGKEPTARQLNNLIAKINREGAAAIFVQSQFPVNAARTLASSVGAQVIELDPLAEDWLLNIRTMGELLQRAIP